MNDQKSTHDIGIDIIGGIKKIEKAALLFAIISVLLMISQSLSSSFIAQVLGFVNEMYEGTIAQEEIVKELVALIENEVINLLISGILLVASFILSLFSIFKYGSPGFFDLKKWRPQDFKSSVLLFRAGFTGGFVSLTLAIALIIHVLFIIYTTFNLSDQCLVEIALSGILLLIGSLLVLLGSIGALIAFFKLGKISGIKLFYVAGALLLIATLLYALTTTYDTTISAIAWISAYIALRTLRRDHSKIQVREDSLLPFPH